MLILSKEPLVQAFDTYSAAEYDRSEAIDHAADLVEDAIQVSFQCPLYYLHSLLSKEQSNALNAERAAFEQELALLREEVRNGL